MGNDSLHASLYQPGLDENNEAVISAHFMDKINANTLLNLYGSEQFYARAFYVSSSWVIENLLPALEKASDHFVSERVSAARKRAIRNYKEYGRHNPKDIDTAEFITEVMFDRQFLKGRKGNCSRMALAKRVKESLENKLPIRMVIPALPYKSTSPLKSRGILPDLSEVNFLLGLAEVAKTISRIYCEDNPAPNSFAKFIVISDGSRFNRFLNEPIENIQAYQQQLNWWINTLNIADYVEIVDYQDVIGNLLPKDQYLQKMPSEMKYCNCIQT